MTVGRCQWRKDEYDAESLLVFFFSLVVLLKILLSYGGVVHTEKFVISPGLRLLLILAEVVEYLA